MNNIAIQLANHNVDICDIALHGIRSQGWNNFQLTSPGKLTRNFSTTVASVIAMTLT